MKNLEEDHWGNNYYVHVDGLHYDAYKTLDDIYKELKTIISTASGEVLIETRDNWLKRLEE